MNLNELLTIAIKASIQAGKKILSYYHQPFKINIKNDYSPVTNADKESQKIIFDYLSKTPYPVISEEMEQIPFEERKKWNICWIVDPLDGTKEFIHKNGEFTVNIALVKNQQPVLGVIFSPASGDFYFATNELGAYKMKVDNFNLHPKTLKSLPIHVEATFIRVAVSRSHSNAQTNEFIKVLKEKYTNVETIVGGSSIKMCMIAEGSAHIYPRFGRTMEWDTAAGHAILSNSNAKILDINTMQELCYNKQNLENPDFIVVNKNLKL